MADHDPRAVATASTGTRHNLTLLGWVGVCALLILQFALFLQFANREIVWGYPMAYDQTTFLYRAYQTFDRMLSDGLLSGLKQGLAERVPQGNLLHLQASAVYLLLGPSRLSSITLNFAHFALLQLVLVWVVRWFARSWAVAYLAMGLLWTTTGRFMVAGGGITDFRLDFISICLFGMAICVVVRSGLLSNPAWAPPVGAVVAYLVLFRHIMLTYVIGIAGVCLLALLVRRRRAGLVAEHQNNLRLRNLIASTGVFLFLSAPLLYYSRQAISAYYFRGHLGPDKEIRKAETGTVELLASLLYYPRSLYNHAGPVFTALVLITFAVLLVIAWRSRGYAAFHSKPRVGLGETTWFLAACFVVPFAILTVDPSKSPVVIGVLLVPLVWLVVIGVTALRGRAAISGDRAVAALAVVTVACGVAVEFGAATRRSPLTLQRDDTNQVLALYDLLAREARQNGWSSPRVAFDRVEDYLHPQTIPVVVYERHGLIINPRGVLGGTVFAVSEQEAVSGLKEADFAILSEERQSAALSPEYFPFNLTIAAIRPRLREIAARNMIPLQRFHLSRWDLVLYQRPSLQIDGGQGGWISGDGLTLTADAATLRARPEIELRGEAVFQAPLGTFHDAEIPGATARWLDTMDTGKSIPLEIRKEGKEYRMRLSLRTDEIPDAPVPRIRLSFDASFVPREKGYNDDPRHLVLPMPDKVSLLPR
jgi:hypothetical protein